MSKKECLPNCIKAWEKRLQTEIPINQWEKIFLLARKNVKDTRVLDIQYKILHRCYASNSTIAKWDSSVSAACKHCDQKSNSA